MNTGWNPSRKWDLWRQESDFPATRVRIGTAQDHLRGDPEINEEETVNIEEAELERGDHQEDLLLRLEGEVPRGGDEKRTWGADLQLL